MVKGRLDRSKEHADISTIGHINHDKIILTAAIATIPAKSGDSVTQSYDVINNAPEEKEHDTTTNTSHIEYQTDKRHCAHVDCPGHADYVKNVIIGAAQMDGGTLVVSATDNLMPQTRRHTLLPRNVGMPALVVLLDKVDVADDEGLLELVEMEARDLLSKYDLPGDDIPVIAGPVLKALEDDVQYEEKILELMEAVDTYIPTPERDSDKPSMISVKGVFSTTGRGTVATGRVERGQIKVGEEAEIVSLHSASRTTATGVEIFRKLLNYAEVGDSVGALLRGIVREDVQHGQVLVAPGSITSHTEFRAEVYVLSKDGGGHHTPLLSSCRPQFYFRTTDVIGVIHLPEGTEVVMSGDNVEMTVELIAPIMTEDGTRFSICEGGRTVGSGVVTKVIK